MTNSQDNGLIARTTVVYTLHIILLPLIRLGTTVAQWLRCCATNRKVAGSIPEGVIGIFH